MVNLIPKTPNCWYFPVHSNWLLLFFSVTVVTNNFWKIGFSKKILLLSISIFQRSLWKIPELFLPTLRNFNLAFPILGKILPSSIYDPWNFWFLIFNTSRKFHYSQQTGEYKRFLKNPYTLLENETEWDYLTFTATDNVNIVTAWCLLC